MAAGRQQQRRRRFEQRRRLLRRRSGRAASEAASAAPTPVDAPRLVRARGRSWRSRSAARLAADGFASLFSEPRFGPRGPLTYAQGRGKFGGAAKQCCPKPLRVGPRRCRPVRAGVARGGRRRLVRRRLAMTRGS
eukprot:361689-Chlamydomonas_euryale.AAC.16